MRSPKSAICAFLLGSLLPGCGPDKPPGPGDGSRGDKPRVVDASDPGVAGAAASAAVSAFDPAAGPFVLTYAADRGSFADTDSLAEVPERSRGMVRVHVLEGPRPPAGKVWVANLRAEDGAGHYPLRTVPLDMFEELALGMGLSSEVELPEGLELPEAPPKADKVVVYKTEWCGVCKKLIAYLDAKGVDYEAKDFEKDPDAAAELQAKAQANGVKAGSVPVVDVAGELMVGFNRAKLEQLL